MSENCIFCKIANGEIKSEFVYENEYVFAINDLSPQAPVHVLVIPKKHVASLNELEDETLMAEMIKGVKAVCKKLDLKEYRTVINTGETAGQSVFHLHFHIMAGRKMNWPAG